MSDLLLNADGDLDVTAGALTLVTGTDAITQQIRIALRLFRGELFTDPDDGMPYFETILQRGVRPAAIESVFRKALMTVPGVLEVLRLVATINTTTRTVALDFGVRVDGTDQPLTFTNFVVR